MQRLGPGLVRLRRPLAAPPLRALGSSIEKKPRLSNVKISDVLQRKHTERWVDSTICYSTTVGEATQIVIERGLSGLMVVDKSTNINSETHQKGKVLGMMTSRDLLRRFSKGRLEGRSFNEVGGEVRGEEDDGKTTTKRSDEVAAVSNPNFTLAAPRYATLVAAG